MTEDLERHFEYMSGFLTEARIVKFDEVLSKRTIRAIAVLEDTVKEQNASAVIRTLDALGFHEVHLVENDHSVELNQMISKGSDKWLNVVKSHNMRETLRSLKARGYSIVATTPHKNGISLTQLNTSDQPIAVVFGNEWNGISEVVMEEADAYLQIPMYGFVESYNLATSVAMVFSHLRWKLNESEISPLPAPDYWLAKLRWSIHSTRSGNMVYNKWITENGHPDLAGVSTELDS